MDFLFLVKPISLIKLFVMRKSFYCIAFLCAFFLSKDINAQSSDIKKEKWHWGNALKQDTSAGYVQVVKVDNVLYISGAVAREVTPEGITRVYQALERSLKSFGASFQNRMHSRRTISDNEDRSTHFDR